MFKFATTAVTTAALAAVLWAPASAQPPEPDCGAWSGYQPGAPWPAFQRCSARLGRSGATGSPTNELNWSYDFWGDVGTPIVGADGTIYVGAGSYYNALSPSGTLRWRQFVWFGPASTGAIGRDGTVYFGTHQGEVWAVDGASGQIRWKFRGAWGRSMQSAPVIGDDGTIYTANIANTVYAIRPDGSLRWQRTGIGAVVSSPVLSRDGRRLYVATETLAFVALDAATGATQWRAPTLVGAASTAAIGGDGTIYVGSNLGILYALSPSDGSARWTLAVDGDILASPAIGPDGSIVFGTGPGSIYSVNQGGQVRWRRSVGAPVLSSPAIDAAGTIFVGAETGNVYALDGETGNELWRRATRNRIFTSSPAIGANGTIYIGSTDNLLYSIGEGIEANALAPPSVAAPSTPRGPLGQPWLVNEYAFCPADPDQGFRSIARYTREWDPGYGDFLLKDLSFVQTGDLDCAARACYDDETPDTSPGALAMLGSVGGRMPDGAITGCEASEARTCSRPRPGTYRNATSCASCSAGELCLDGCPRDPATGNPLGFCEPDDYVTYCATPDVEACGGFVADDDECHEVRECARPQDVYTKSQTAPACASGDCDAPQIQAAPTTTPPNEESFPDFPLFSRSFNAAEERCGQTHPERASNGHEGGKAPGSGDGRKRGKWGAGVDAKVGADYQIRPLTGGRLSPYANAATEFEVWGRAMGKEITLLYVGGSADIDACRVNANANVTLFGTAIAGADLGVNFGDDGGFCQQVFDELELRAGGAVKGALIDAARMVTAILDADADARTISKAMCQQARTLEGDGVFNCNEPLTRQRAADIVNHYIDEYEQAVRDSVDLSNVLADEYIANTVDNFKGALQDSGLSTDTVPVGFAQDLPLFDLGEEFSIVGANAVFPIGPLALVLEIEGSGDWGISGDLNFGYNLIAGDGERAAWAGGGITPHAGIDVLVYLGVGFDFGIGGASAGIGGNVSLVDIRAPVRGDVTLVRSSEQAPSVRWPDSLARFEAEGEVVPRRKHTWKLSSQLRAVAEFEALSGELDVRLKIRFLFFKKVWKKRLVKFAALIKKKFEWVGKISGDVGVTLPSPDLDVMPKLPYPKLPRLKASDFPALPSLPDFGVPEWPTTSDPELRDRLGVIDDAVGRCVTRIILI